MAILHVVAKETSANDSCTKGLRLCKEGGKNQIAIMTLESNVPLECRILHAKPELLA